MQKGFVLFEIHSDLKSNRKVYIFNDSNQLRNATIEFKSK